MNKREQKILSVALLSADLAWNLLTPEQQRQSLEYLKRVNEKEKTREDPQEIHTQRRFRPSQTN